MHLEFDICPQIEMMAQFMAPDRIERLQVRIHTLTAPPFIPLDSLVPIPQIQTVLEKRTFSVLPVVEGLYNMGNLAAVCRSADGEHRGGINGPVHY